MATVFLDLDGTLLENGKPAHQTLEAINQLKANGHFVVIATGRVPYLSRQYMEFFGIDTIICASGVYIIHQEEVIFERAVPLELLKKLFKAADEYPFDIVSEAVDDYVAYRKDSEAADIFADYFHVKRPIVDKEYHFNHPILAFNFFDEKVVSRLQSEFPEFVINRASDLGFDLNQKGDLKADGLRFVIKHFNLDPSEVYAIGDGLNDVSMIQTAAHGIAMGNASDEVKKAADFVTLPVSEGGVFYALQHFKLI